MPSGHLCLHLRWQGNLPFPLCLQIWSLGIGCALSQLSSSFGMTESSQGGLQSMSVTSETRPPMLNRGGGLGIEARLCQPRCQGTCPVSWILQGWYPCGLFPIQPHKRHLVLQEQGEGQEQRGYKAAICLRGRKVSLPGCLS